jgi:hypothetical protein
VLHGSAASPSAVSTPVALGGPIFKTYGFGPNAVWMVGDEGRVFFFDGQQLRDVSPAGKLTLRSVSGVDAQHVYVVGGGVEGVIYRRDGEQWVDETPPGLPSMNSVWATSAEEAYAVGFNGRVYARKQGSWAEFTPLAPTYQDLHSVWVDEQGGVWIAGGRLAADPPTDGVVLYYGPRKLKDGGT